MFTLLVQLWLAVVSIGLLCLALQGAFCYLRDGRRNRQLLAAHYYAQLVVMDRVQKGDYKTTDEIRQAYEFEKIAYLNS